MPERSSSPERRRGIGIDSFGGQVIDPTKNVLDLVQAAIQRQDDLRAAETRRVNEKIEAETQRLNDLAALRVYYETIIQGLRSDSLKLLAEQLKDSKEESGKRTALLEQFRWESGGKFSGASALWGYLIGAAGVLYAIYVHSGR